MLLVICKLLSLCICNTDLDISQHKYCKHKKMSVCQHQIIQEWTTIFSLKLNTTRFLVFCCGSQQCLELNKTRQWFSGWAQSQSTKLSWKVLLNVPVVSTKATNMYYRFTVKLAKPRLHRCVAEVTLKWMYWFGCVQSTVKELCWKFLLTHPILYQKCADILAHLKHLYQISTHLSALKSCCRIIWCRRSGICTNSANAELLQIRMPGLQSYEWKGNSADDWLCPSSRLKHWGAGDVASCHQSLALLCLDFWAPSSLWTCLELLKLGPQCPCWAQPHSSQYPEMLAEEKKSTVDQCKNDEYMAAVIWT